MRNKFKFDPNSRNQQRKRAKAEALKKESANGKKPIAKKPIAPIAAVVKRKINTKKVNFQGTIGSQIEKSPFLEALSETLSPFTPNTVAEAILSLLNADVSAEGNIARMVGEGSFSLSQLDVRELWSFVGEWCTEVANEIWLRYQEVLAGKYKSIQDVRVLGCLVRAFYGPSEIAVQWCTEVIRYIMSQPSEKLDMQIALSFLSILHVKNRDLTHFISSFLKSEAELYTSSASKRDWLRLFSILNMGILYLPSNDVVFFSKVALKHLLQNSPAEVQQASLSMLDVLLSSGLSTAEGKLSPLPPSGYFQILQNLLKCNISQESQIGAAIAQNYCRTVKDASIKFFALDSEKTIREILPPVFVKMIQYLRVAESNLKNDAVANTACKSIEEIAIKCFSEDMVRYSIQVLNNNSGETTIVLNLITVIEGLFSVEFKSQLPRILQLIQTLFEKFKRDSFYLLRNVLLKVDELYQLQDETLTFSIERTFGTAAKYMGVHGFLEILPIGKRPDPRLWIFRVLRSKIANNDIRLYQKELFSKIQGLEKKVMKAQEAGNAAEVTKLMNLLDEIWGLMIDFLVFPSDLDETVLGELVQIWLNIFKSIPRRRSVACRALMRLIQTNVEYIEYSEGQELSKEAAILNFKDSVVNYSVEKAKYALELIGKQAEALFSSLFTLFITVASQNDVSLRDLVGVTITTLASVSNTTLVSNFFKLILVKMLKSSQESDEDHQKQRLIMLDLAGAVSPYLNEEMSVSFNNVLTPMLSAMDRPLQKKANKALMHMCSKNKHFVEKHGGKILDHLCSILNDCDPAAKKYRIALLDALVVGAAPDSIQRNISHMIGEGLISAKEVSSEARDNAVDFLDSLFRRVTFGSTTVKVDAIPRTPELVEAASNFMKALVSGLGGTSADMISGTIDVIGHLLHKYIEFFEPVVENLFKTVVLLIDYPHITVVLAAFKFLKICLSDLEESFMDPYLRTIVPSIYGAIERHSRCLVKAKHLLEKMSDVFTPEVIENLTPEKHKRLIRNIQREMRREERKKTDPKTKSTSEAVRVDENFDLKGTVVKKDENDEEDEEMTTIFEGKDTEVSIEKTGKVVVSMGGKRKRDEVNLDDFNEKAEDKESESEEEVEVFESRKRRRFDPSKTDSSALDITNQDDPHARHYLEIRAKQRRRRDPTEKISMGREYRSKKGRGDIKKGSVDPYAYLPLDPNQLNRRNRNKKSIFDKFAEKTKK